MTQPIPGLITLQALTFLHPGTGQTTGVVDLPVQREVHSGHPMYASSGLKGSLRDKAEQKLTAPEITTIFGSEAGSTEGEKTVAGALVVTDGRILAFPVRSLQHVFVWVTCPIVINRLHRDAGLIHLPGLDGLSPIPSPPPQDTVWVKGDIFSDPLILEELAFTVDKKEEDTVDKVGTAIKALVGETGFDSERLVLVTDEDFSYFVEHATQVTARIKLNKQKTTTGGGGNLWYEETLPPETILYAFALCHKPRKPANGISDAVGVADMFKKICKDNYLQIGGNETVGQGWCHVNLHLQGRNGEDKNDSDA